MGNKGGCGAVLLLSLVVSLGCNVFLWQQWQSSKTSRPEGERLGCLRNVASRMGVEVPPGAVEGDIASNINILLNEAQWVPTNKFSQKAFKAADGVIPKEDSLALRKILDFCENNRGCRVVVLPGGGR